MKKSIMMIVAGLALAATTQAAQIDWSSANNAVIWMASGTTTAPAGTAFYLVLDSYVAGITSAILDGSFSSGTAGVLDMETSSNTRGAIALNAATSDLLQLGGTLYTYRLLVFDSAAGVDYFQFSAGIANTAYTPGDPDYAEPQSVAFGGTHFSTENWEAVPEPTSLALLALGVAAIGLRRKFRK